jgi:hypothetical protein
MNARCGRCGLWSEYPADHREQKYAGVCLWFQTRLVEDEVYEPRACGEFFERIPDLTPMDHFNYKTKRDNLGDAYTTARRSKRLAVFGVVTSLTSLAFSAWKVFGG